MSLIYTAPAASAGVSSGNGLYIGGKKEAKSRSTLERWGITHILNVTPEKDSSIQAGVPNYFEGKAGSSSKFVYRRIPVYDTATSDLLSQADAIVGFISSGLHHGSVLVHCKEGVSRSTTCVIFFLMRKLGMSYADAFEICKRKRPVAQPIPSFVDQCKKYERKCRKLGVIQSGESSMKKKRKIMGPSIGPAIGPAMGPAMGPSLEPGPPSAVAQERSTDNPTGEHEEEKVCVAKEGGDGRDDHDRKRESKKAKIIGPALPPGAG